MLKATVKRRGFVSVIFLFALFILAFIMGKFSLAQAENPVLGSDGTYSVSVDLSGMAMGADNFSSVSTVEKFGGKYYMSFGHSSSITDLTFDKDGKKVGCTVREEDGWTIYTYTLDETGIQSAMSFTAHINAMNRDVSFSVSLNLAGAVKISDSVSDSGERPAEFVPVITTVAGTEYEAEYGKIFTIPAATAKLGDDDCSIEVYAYYVSNGERTDISVTNNQFKLENVGEYHFVYRASNSKYQTSLGNDTYTEFDAKVISKAGATELVKYYDGKNIVPANANLQSSRVSSGTVYEIVSGKMKKIADSYEVISVNLYDESGNEIKLDDTVTLYLQAKSTFERNETAVYYLDNNGNLTRLNSSPYGRYVAVDTAELGTFIVCIPGVAFVMPMWGYAVIVCVGAAVVIAAIIVTVILVKRKNKKITN